MDTESYIEITEICSSYRIDNSFLYSLREYGLVQIVAREDQEFIPMEQVSDLERFVRMYYDLKINLEGIDVICNLLDRVHHLQLENQDLRNRLIRWEE